MSTLLAVTDGLVNGEYDAADWLLLIAAIMFVGVTFMHFQAKATVSALTTLAFTLVSVALLVL